MYSYSRPILPQGINLYDKEKKTLVKKSINVPLKLLQK